MRLIYSFLILLVSFSSCARPPSSHFRGFAMNMPYHVEIGRAISRQDKLTIQKIIDGTFAQVDQISNHWNALSEVSLFNHSTSTEKKYISPYLLELINLANNIVELSEGRYDPTLGPVIGIWKAALNQQKTPSSREILSCSNNTGWEHLHIENNHIRKDIPKLHLDLDAVAKGMAVDVLISELVEYGYTDVCVEWAGEIRAHGQHIENRPWRIAIYRPENSPKDVIEMKNEAIATSGNYMQYWAVPGSGGKMKLYSHLINKKNLKPLELGRNGILSISVKAPTCALADGLATAAMLVENPEELEKWTKKIQETIPGVSFWIVKKQSIE